MDEGRETRGLLIGVETGDPVGGVTVISIGGTTATFLLVLFFFSFVGMRYPLRAFILAVRFRFCGQLKSVKCRCVMRGPPNNKDEASEVFGEVD